LGCFAALSMTLDCHELLRRHTIRRLRSGIPRS
jgi:hypothetical protein